MIVLPTAAGPSTGRMDVGPTEAGKFFIDTYSVELAHNLIVLQGKHPDTLYLRKSDSPLLQTAQKEGEWEIVFLLLKNQATCSDSNTLLQEAATANAWKVVEYLLNHNESINVQQCEDILTTAWRVGQWGVVEALFKKDINLDVLKSLDVLPVHQLGAIGTAQDADAFSSKPKNFNEYIPMDTRGRTPLHIACAFGNESWIKLYLEQTFYTSKGPPSQQERASPSKSINSSIFHSKDMSGKTPLAIFLERGVRIREMVGLTSPLYQDYLELTERVVSLFLESGADTSFEKDSSIEKMFKRIQRRIPSSRNENDENHPQRVRSWTNHTPPSHETAGFMKKFGSIMRRTFSSSGSTSKEMTVKKRQVNGSSKSRKKHPLIIACEKDSSDEVDKLLDFGTNGNSGKGEGGKKALHIACGNGNEDIVRMLVNRGKADVNARDDMKQFPLHYACQIGHIEIANFLLVKGASPNAMNKNKCTPFNEACKTKNINLVRALLLADAIISPEEENVETPLHSACQAVSEEVIEILLKNGAKPEATWNGKFPSDLIPKAKKKKVLQKFPILLEHDKIETSTATT